MDHGKRSVLSAKRGQSRMNDLKRSWEIEQKVKELLTRANIERARGNYEKALEFVKKADEISPNNSKVLEVYGDILQARGKLKEALEKYNAALKSERRQSIEEKIAIVTLKIAEIERREELKAWLREHPEYRPKGKNPTMATIASMAIPGSGQIYNGDIAKGIILFALFILSFIGWFTPLSDALHQAAKSFNAIDVSSLREVMRNWSIFKLIWTLFSSLLCIGVWTYAIVEAGITALQLRRIAQLEVEEAFKRQKEENEAK